YFFFFFFSSRRRHTRWPRDWSSDVCSSDLADAHAIVHAQHRKVIVDLVAAFDSEERRDPAGFHDPLDIGGRCGEFDLVLVSIERSEERRVGKECRARWRMCE